MTMPRAAALLLATTLLASPAMAADATPEQARALEGDLRGWMAGLLGAAIDVGTRPIEVTPAGEALSVRIPAPAMIAALGVVEPGLAVTLKARKMDGGRWALDDLRLPSPLKLMMPGESTGAEKTTLLNWSIDSQDFHAIFDPSFATTSSFDTIWRGYRTVATNQTTLITRSSGHTVLQPADKGRINLISESNGEQLDASIEVPGAPPFTYKATAVRSSGKIANLSPDNLAALVRSLTSLAGLKDTKAQGSAPTEEQRKLARTAVLALRDLFASMDASTSFEGMSVSGMGQSATLKKASFGVNLGTPEGKLSLGTSIALNDFASAAIPPGILRDYMPRSIVLKPRVGGFPSEDATRLLLKLIDTDPADMAPVQADALAVLAANPVEIAIDELTIDLGRASIEANGSIEVTSPTEITGEAEISLKGLDALIRRANSDAELKQFAPVLIFLKGIGKKDGEAYTWSINYEGGKFSVNDTDMSEMAGMLK
jgi:hypothetical protein